MHQVTQQEIQEIMRQLLKSMAKALEEGKMEVEDSETSARFMAEHFPSQGDMSGEEMASILETLTVQWPAYESVKQSFHKRLAGGIDNQKIEEVKQRLQQLTGAAISS